MRNNDSLHLNVLGVPDLDNTLSSIVNNTIDT